MKVTQLPPNEEETYSEPISLEEVKLWLKVEIDDDDDLIESLISASRSHCEIELNRSLMIQNLQATFDGFGDEIDLPFPPVIEVTEVEYIDTNGDLQTLDNEAYWVSLGTPSRIVSKDKFPETQNRPDSVLCTYSAGGNVSETVKTAMKMLISHWYTNRSAVETGTIATEIPLAVKTILQNERNWRFC